MEMGSCTDACPPLGCCISSDGVLLIGFEKAIPFEAQGVWVSRLISAQNGYVTALVVVTGCEHCLATLFLPVSAQPDVPR